MLLNSVSKVTSLDLYQKGIIAESRAMQEVIKIALRVAPVDCPVLVWGETGVGKEVIARLIHESSGKEKAPFVKVNCGAIPENLLEAELFGYEEGAFTGAKKGGKPGKFELAHGGTILLDEIGTLPLHLQVKLLRVLQENEVVRVGGVFPRPFKVRVVAATNKDLWDLVLRGCFREDLYFRLNVVPIYIPPLRERREDIMPLIRFFKKMIEKKYQFKKACSPEVVNAFQSYDWPGNVRELENVLHRLYLMTEPEQKITPEILIKHYFNVDWQSRQGKRITVHELAPLREIVQETEGELLKMAFKRFRTMKEVAEVLGVDQSTISRKVQRLGFKPC